MQLLKITILILLSNYTIIQGCASILGGTVDEQKKAVHSLVAHTLADLTRKNHMRRS